jgi:hypothetical protein
MEELPVIQARCISQHLLCLLYAILASLLENHRLAKELRSETKKLFTVTGKLELPLERSSAW